MKRDFIFVLIKFFILLSFLFLLINTGLFAFNSTELAENLKERGLNPLLITGLISIIPVFELRGAIPVGIALFKQNILSVFMISFIFNLIPVIPIILLIIPIRNLFISKGIFKRFFLFLENRAKNNRDLVEKYGEWGLTIFVAVPLPVTGAWTGSLIAAFVGFPLLKSFLHISFGVFIAGLIVTGITVIGTKSLVFIAPVIIILIGYLIFKLYLNGKRKRGKLGK